MKTRSLLFTTLAGAALLASQSASSAVIDAVMIDDFYATQTVSVTAAAPPDQTGFSSVAAGTAIGGERDLLVTKTVGVSGEEIRARVNPLGSNLLRMTNGETRGKVTVSWDGTDNSSLLDASGLGGIDLTGGLLNPFFEIKLTFSDIGGPIILVVYQQGSVANFAQATLTAPGGVPSGSSVLLTEAFGAFSVTGSASLNDIFTNTGAILMTIDASGALQEGWDMRLDYVKTRGTVPVSLPGGLALLGLGLTLMRRRII